MEFVRAFLREIKTPVVFLASDDGFASFPHAQRSTGKTIYVKGPYGLKDNSFIKNIMHLLFLHRLCSLLEIPNIAIYPCELVIIEGQGSPHSGEPAKVYFKYETVGCRIIKRSMRIQTVADIEKQNPSLLIDDVKFSIMRHLYCLWLLNIGDNGTHNILISTDYQSVYGVNIEESKRGNKNDLSLYNLLGKSRVDHRIYRNIFETRIRLLHEKVLDTHMDILFRTNEDEMCGEPACAQESLPVARNLRFRKRTKRDF